jgi:transcriptional regulator of acetoin/glycerol metabolism
VRELHNVLERAVLNSDEHRLEVADFHGLGKASASPGQVLAPAPEDSSYVSTMAEAERRILAAALAACNGKVVDAARRLGIGRATFYKRMTALQRLSQKGDLSPKRDGSGKPQVR